MSHLNPGLISVYNSLTDRHLAGYFSNTRIRRHLQRAGLITRSGRIVPDKEYRYKLIQRAHQRHVRECLAQAIFHKVLEMERVHQIEIKRKLEEFARRERVHKIKVERSKRYEEDIIRILSPRPPTGARCIRKQNSGPEGEHSESSESPGSSRPNTAPGKMQRPVRLKPIHSNSTTASLRRSSPHRLLESSNDNSQPFNCTMDKASRRHFTTTEVSRGISPYCLPVINNFVTPVPPATKRKERGAKVTMSGTLRGRRLRPTTANSGADVNEDPPMLRSSVHQSRVCVNMMYFGKTVHLSHDLTDMRDEVKVFQQHCGGENLCVFKGKLREGETFQFISRRHRGFPFSLTFFLNGLQVERLSSCCEFKHRKGSRLGGRHGHFGFCSVEGASPCYKCIIAMGLDKKPTPPPKRVKEDEGREESVTSHKDAPEMETERTGDDAASLLECETSQPQDTETQVKEETAAEEDKVRDDYEEDFEGDDEGPPEDVEAEEKISSSPSGETERQVKERDASETEDDERDEDIKSHSGSSSSGSDQEESDAEATKESREDEKAEQPKEVDQEETVVPPDEKKDEPNPEEAIAAEAEPAGPKDSDIQDSARDSTEIEVYNTGVPSGNENKQRDDTSGDKEVEKTVDENKQEEEPERAKSVQEKLAEAILKESQCSSEPELSDTSTEEEEESTDKGPEQDSKDAVAVKSVTLTEQQQTLEEETKCEEGVVGENQVVKDDNETSEPKDREKETEREPQENSDRSKDDTANEQASSEEDKNTAEEDKPEDTALHPISEEEVTEDDKTSEPQEDAAAKPTDGEAADSDEENEEKTEAVADETGQRTKSGEEDESSVSEPDKKGDETAAPDNAEADAMTASETMEMKAEPSEEREALNCEEAPVTDTEKRQQGDSKDGDAASETEVTAENSRSSLEGSGDATVDKTVDESEGNANDESSKDDVKGEEASAIEDSKDDIKGEEASAIEDSKDDIKGEEASAIEDSKDDIKGEEASAIEDSIDDIKGEEASAIEDSKDDIKGEDVSAIEDSKDDIKGEDVSAIEDSKDDIKGEDVSAIEDSKDDIKGGDVSAIEDSKDDNQQHGGDPGEEQTERSPVEIDDEVEEKCEEEGSEEEKQTSPDEKTEGGNREESEKKEKDETEEGKNNESKTEERIENEENISEGTKCDSNAEGKANEEQAEELHSEEEVKVASEEDADKSEKTERDEDGECAKNINDEEDSEEKGAATDETNECEKMNAAADEKDDEAEKEENKDDDESEEKQVVTDKTAEGEKISEIPEESEKSGDADLDKDNVKISDENIAESEDVTDRDTANVAQGTKTAEEMPNKAMEAEDGVKEAEGESGNSEKGDVDDENGEISTRAENKAVDEGEAQQANTAVNTEEGRRTEEPTEGESAEVKEVTVESRDDAEKHEDDKVDEGPDADVVQSEAEDGNDGAEKRDEATKNDSEPETSVTEVKEESESDDREEGETKQDENGDISDPKNDSGDSDLMKKSDNVQSGVREVLVVSAVDPARSPSPTAALYADDTPHKVDESTAPPDSTTDKHPHAEENASAADLSAADGENGADTEEASKASEEGASVLLKPQARPSQLMQNGDVTEESVAVGDSAPEALAREDNTDLVTNWVTMHQTSKYFETFVEPLEELKESTSDAQVSNSSEERTQSTEPPRSASPLRMAKVSEHAEEEQTAKDESESGDKSKEETVVSNLESNHSEDSEPCERDTLQVEEETEVKHSIPKTESELNDKESVSGRDTRSEEHKGSKGSPDEDKVHEGFMQDDSEQTDISQTEVESMAGSRHSGTSGRPESVSENRTEEKTTDNGPGTQTAIEEAKDLLPSSKTEKHRQYSTSPEGLSRSKDNEPSDGEEAGGKSDEQSQEVTEITDFTTSKSDDGSQEEESRRKDAQPESSDAGGDKRDVQLIQDIKHTLSIDRLSTFSVDGTLFGRSSYPLLAAARTESGH